MKTKELHIFDLDDTVVDSAHRTPYKENGDLDLFKYREMISHENIMNDTLLPLFDIMREFIEDGKEVAIITARRLTKSDYLMLRRNGIRTPYIGSRDKLYKLTHISNCAHTHFKMKDGEYKRIWFKDIKNKYPINEYNIYMYDDNQNVLKVAEEEGFHAIDAIHLNNMITGNI